MEPSLISELILKFSVIPPGLKENITAVLDTDIGTDYYGLLQKILILPVKLLQTLLDKTVFWPD